MKKALPFAIVSLLSACGGPATTASAPNESINQSNAPSILGEVAIVADPEQLPSQGAARRPVWYGSYFPPSGNGTAAAMQKYDRATGNGSKAFDWEVAQNQRIANVSWSGHCNGLAAAGINEPEPVRPVTYNGIRFSVDDVKALLVETYQDGRGGARLVGYRCNLESPDVDEFGRPTDPGCRDLNPGAFHLVVTNYLGRAGLPVIIDAQRERPVWNYAIKGYRFTFEPLEANEAARAVGSSSYHFNRNAEYFMKVHMVLASASGEDFAYDYILEGNAQQLITGGEWIGESKTNHPDFIWRQRSMSAENPFLDLDVIREIARLSQ